MSDNTNAPAKPGSIATPKFKRGVKGFWSDTKREMTKVSWPTRKETTRLSGVVISLVVIVSAALVGFGWVADTIINIVTGGKG